MNPGIILTCALVVFGLCMVGGALVLGFAAREYGRAAREFTKAQRWTQESIDHLDAYRAQFPVVGSTPEGQTP